MKTLMHMLKIYFVLFLIAQVIFGMMIIGSALNVVELDIQVLNCYFNPENAPILLTRLSNSITHTLLTMFLFHKLNAWNKEVELSVHLNKVANNAVFAAIIYSVVYFVASCLLLGYYRISLEFLVYLAYAVVLGTISNIMNPQEKEERKVRDWFINFFITEE